MYLSRYYFLSKVWFLEGGGGGEKSDFVAILQKYLRFLGRFLLLKKKNIIYYRSWNFIRFFSLNRNE